MINNLKEIEEIINIINTKGYAIIDDYIESRDMLSFKEEINKINYIYKKDFFTLINLCNKKESIFNLFITKYKLNLLAQRIAEANANINSLNKDHLNVLRVIHKDPLNQNSLKFHFDASAITILIPIEIPSSIKNDHSGDLIIFPNVRKFNSTLLSNLFIKLFYQNRFARMLLYKKIKNNVEDHILKLHPGKIYIFWGYRSFHANMTIVNSINRATLIFHYNFLHSESLILRLIRALRFRVEKHRLNKLN